MGLKKLAGKVDDYNDRLKAGKIGKIKPEDVEKVMAKLIAKEAALLEEIAETGNPSKIPRLERKLSIAREHIARAKWLLGQIEAPAADKGALAVSKEEAAAVTDASAAAQDAPPAAAKDAPAADQDEPARPDQRSQASGE